MSQSYGPTPGINDGPVQTENFLRRADHHAERLIEFPESDVGLRDACCLQRQGDSERGGGGEIDGCAGGIGIAYEV